MSVNIVLVRKFSNNQSSIAFTFYAFVTATIINGERLYPLTVSARRLVILVKAMKELKNSAPSNIRKIIAVVTAVSCITSSNS